VDSCGAYTLKRVQGKEQTCTRCEVEDGEGWQSHPALLRIAPP